LVEEEANVTRMMELGSGRGGSLMTTVNRSKGEGEKRQEGAHTEGKGRSSARVLRGGGRWRMERGEWNGPVTYKHTRAHTPHAGYLPSP
jgi:hypothetical protein